MIVRFGAKTIKLVEAAFKVFDKTFLHARRNKRDDRLLHIILKIWFPSYLEHYHSRERPSVVLQRTLKRAFTLWENNAIKPIEPHEQPANFKAIHAFVSHTSHKDTDGEVVLKTHYCGFRDRDGRTRRDCTCSAFVQGSTACEHLWALRFWIEDGAASLVDEEIAVCKERCLPLPMDDCFVKPDVHGVAWDLVYGEDDSEGEEETSDADEGADTDEKKSDEICFP